MLSFLEVVEVAFIEVRVSGVMCCEEGKEYVGDRGSVVNNVLTDSSMTASRHVQDGFVIIGNVTYTKDF